MTEQEQTEGGLERAAVIFDRACELHGEARKKYLEAECGGDASLLGEVESMLNAQADQGEFLADPTMTAASKLTEQPGTVIGNYKLLQCVGEGGFGVVYMAEQRAPVTRTVALKVVKPGMDTREVIARFEAERQALALMEHPNVAKVLDAGSTDSGRPYFVMELVRGLPITDYADKNRLSVRDRLQLFMTVCRAVQHAHQKGVIHRDIKPSNVMVTLHDGQPVVKVIDFGVSKALNQKLTERTLFTAYGQMIGTPQYMSPEQAEMSGLDVDTRSDIYSLGVLLYELLTGTTPLDARRLRDAGYAQMQHLIQEEETPRPSTRLSTPGEDLTVIANARQLDPKHLRQLVRGELDWIVMKAMEKERARRYETANGFAEDICRYLENEPVAAGPPSGLYRLGKFARRNKAALTFAGTIAALLLLGAFTSSIFAVYATRARNVAEDAEREAQRAGERLVDQLHVTQQAQRETQNASDALKDNLTRTAFVTAANLIENDESSKGLAYLAYSLRTDPTYWPAAARLISTLTERGFSLDDLPPITHDQPIYDYVLDEKTGLLATRGKDYDIRIWDAWNSKLLQEIPKLGSRRMPSLAPEGKRVLCVMPDGSVQCFDPWSRPDVPVFQISHGQRAVDAKFGPQGEGGLLVVTRAVSGAVRLWNADNGAAATADLSAGTGAGDFLEFTPDGRKVCASFADGTVVVWDTASGASVGKPFQVTPGSHLILTPDSRTLVERGADDRSIRFWDVETGEPRGEAFVSDEVLARLPSEPGTVALGPGHDHDFEFSPDGQLMVAVYHETFAPYSDGFLHDWMSIRLFDTLSGKLLNTISRTNVTHHEENMVAGLGSMVIDSNRLIVHSLTTGEVLVDQKVPSAQIVVTRLTPAGDRILVALNDHRLILFDARTGNSLTDDGLEPIVTSHTGRTLRPAQLTRPMRHGPMLRDLSFDPEGEKFFALYRDSSLQLWDVREGLPLSEPLENASGRSIEFSSDGQKFLVHGASGSQGGRDFRYGWIRIYSRDLSAARHRPLQIPGRERPAVGFSPDGKLGFDARNRTISLWDAASRTVIREIDQPDPIYIPAGIAWLIAEAWMSADGRHLLTAGGKTARVFDVQSGKLIRALEHSTGVGVARFAGSGSRIVTVSQRDGQLWIKVWDVDSQSPAVEGPCPVPSFSVLDVSPDGSRIAVASDRGTYVLDIETLAAATPVLRHPVEGAAIYVVRFSPDSRKLVTTCIDNTARVWNVEDGELIADLQLNGWPRAAAFGPRSDLLVTADKGRYEAPDFIKVWDISGGQAKLVAGPLEHSNCIQDLVVSPNGQLVLAGDRAGVTKLWDIASGQAVLEPIEHPEQVSRVRFHPEGRMILSAPWPRGASDPDNPGVGLGGEAPPQLRALPPAGAAVPDWLPQLAEGVAGFRLNEAGGLEVLTREHLWQVKQEVLDRIADPADQAFYAKWAQWFLADRSNRAVAPMAQMTVREEVQELIDRDSLQSLHKAVHIDPTNVVALSRLALKRLEYDAATAQWQADPHFRTPAEWLADLVTQRAPHWSPGWIVEGDIADQLGHTEAAIAAAQRAVQLDPENPDGWALKSAILLRTGQGDGSKQGLSKALASPLKAVDAASHSFLTPANLALRLDQFDEASVHNRVRLGLLGRDPDTPGQFVDLTPFYNRPLPEAWSNHLAGSNGNAVDGVRFDARGLLLLDARFTGEGLPTRIVRIPIRQHCLRLHLLMLGGSSDGPCGTLRLRYSDGDTATEILQLTPPTSSSPSVITLDNPHPDKQIDSVDVIAALESGLQLAAISVQLHPQPVITLEPTSRAITLGDKTRFRVEVADESPWAFQWLFDGTPIAGADNTMLEISSTGESELGRYAVEVRSRAPDPAMAPVRSRTVFLVDRSEPIVRGSLQREVFLNVSGENVSDLIQSPRYADRPDVTDTIEAWETPSDNGDNYGVRITGFVIPPTTGDYVFYLCSDDSSQLYLSDNEFPSNKELIASVSGYHSPRAWSELSSESVSQPVRLEAGKRYYVETLMKEGGGQDNVAVTWQEPNAPPPTNGAPPIPGDYLAHPLP